MDDLTKEIVKALGPDLIKKLYDEGLSDAMKETSFLLTDVVKTLRLFAAPIQIAAKLQDRLQKYLQEVTCRVPEEQQIPAQSSIAGPIFENLKYVEEDNPLTQLYLNLLTRAIDRERVHEAHPAFAGLISNLSPDEALLLLLISQKVHKMVDTMDYIQPKNQFENRKIVSNTIPISEFIYPENFEMYMSHLTSLDLANWPIMKQDPINNAQGIQTGITRHVDFKLTDFGELFVKACIPDDL